jgi:ParB family chromosome partitioning protein
MKQARLGRGLSALLGDYAGARNAIEGGESMTAEANAPSTEDMSASEIAIDRIVPNPKQPRRTFVEADLEELTESIKTKG